MPQEKFTRPPLQRLMHIHAALRAKRRVDAIILARELDVTPKTIYRDVGYMRERMNLPVDFDHYTKLYRYKGSVGAFPTLTATEGEVAGLLIASKALAAYRGTRFHKYLADSVDKIAAALPGKVSFRHADELNAISFKSFGAGKTDIPIFNALSRALLREQVVTYMYRKVGSPTPTPRRVEPHHLTNRDNMWYLVAREDGKMKTFAVPRISQVEILKTRFRPDPEFSEEKYFASALGVFGGDGNYRVLIRFSAAVADRVREREWHVTEKLRDLPGGELEFEVSIGALHEIERWVLQWGEHARVLEPPELRARMAKTAAALAREYL